MPLFYDLVAIRFVRAGTVVAATIKTRAQHEISNQSIQTTIWVGGAWVMICHHRRTGQGYQEGSTDESLAPPRGFTIVEVLVVVVIILMFSAVALPTILPALRHRQLREAERLLQAALVGAHDQAIHDGRPSGIRLLPDPTYPIERTSIGTINPWTILAYNRCVPLEPAPEYNDGLCTPVPSAAVALSNGWSYQISDKVAFSWTHGPLPYLIVVESPADPGNGLPNAPTSWFWNIRVGDKIQFNGAGPLYTVVGPMTIAPGQGNTEMFVNVGLPGPLSKLAVPTINGQPVEYLALVNSQDDNTNGWIDEEFDGVDNDGNGLIDDVHEWEYERWRGAFISQAPVNIPYTIPYTILRRPAPVSNGHEVSLPTAVVIDATTALLSRERSRLPVNPYTGYVDIMLEPDGTILPTVIYSVPTSFGMAEAFYHFWLAERADLAAPPAGATVPPLLPIAAQGGANGSQYPRPSFQGNYGVLTLYTRTGEIVPNETMPFDDPAVAASERRPFNVNMPFTGSQQGAAGS
jgi:prepilin-type N-terminal cleavage/methylation domain-containing protein